MLIRGIWQDSWKNFFPLNIGRGRYNVQICPLSCSRFFSHFVQMFPISTSPPSLAIAALMFICHDLGLEDLLYKQTRFCQIFFCFAKRRKHVGNDNSVLECSDYTIKVSTSFIPMQKNFNLPGQISQYFCCQSVKL